MLAQDYKAPCVMDYELLHDGGGEEDEMDDEYVSLVEAVELTGVPVRSVLWLAKTGRVSRDYRAKEKPNGEIAKGVLHVNLAELKRASEAEGLPRLW